MTTLHSNKKFNNWLPCVFGAGLLVSFFLPWVSWDGNSVSGYGMPRGDFFSLAETKFGLGNPFPKLSFVFNIFLLIPALSLLVVVLAVLHKKTVWPAAITGVL